MFGLSVGTIVKIATAIAAVLFLWWVWHEVNNWCNNACVDQRTRADKVQLAYDTAVNEAKAKIAALDAANTETTNKYKQATDAYLVVAKAAQTNLQERIKSDKALASVKLSINSISLFNQSKDSPGAVSEGTTTTNPIHDGEGASTTATVEGASTTATVEGASTAKTLADLQLVVAINDANHLNCIKKVELWQGFWQDYANNVLAVPE